MKKISDNKISVNNPKTPKRRTFLQWLWFGLGGLAVFECILLGLSFLRPTKRENNPKSPENIIDAGNIDTFKPGTVTAFIRGQFYLVCLDGGGFLALSAKCTHLGCSVPWVEEKKQFICPCHSSKFGITGEVLSPPAPRPLDMFLVEILNDNIRVDLGQRIRRKIFSKDQPAYPESIKFKAKTS